MQPSLGQEGCVRQQCHRPRGAVWGWLEAPCPACRLHSLQCLVASSLPLDGRQAPLPQAGLQVLGGQLSERGCSSAGGQARPTGRPGQHFYLLARTHTLEGPQHCNSAASSRTEYRWQRRAAEGQDSVH